MARERVLVVEDQELVRMILEEVLNDKGFHAVEASTGDEAAALIDGPAGFHAVVTGVGAQFSSCVGSWPSANWAYRAAPLFSG